MYVVVASWKAKPGEGHRVVALFHEMASEVAMERGCRQYTLNRSVDDPDEFLLYEQYDDEAAFHVHLQTDAFQRIVVDKIVPLLAERSRKIYSTP